ncbi:MAG: LamG domain-containing protein [Bacteroidota bacterium]|nr:LamG domain-containing protein [Bacteroidota bacterium]
MKTTKNVFITALTGIVIVFTISSCQKKFDAGTYAPTKPLPSYGGYSSSKDIDPASLVAYWAFNNSLIDSVSKTAGVSTGTSFGAGVAKGKGLQGALNSYVLSDASTALANLHSFTISVWVNTPPPSTGIIGFFSLANTKNFWGNMDMFFENGSDNTNGKLRFHMSQAGGDFTFSVDNVPNMFGKWVNIIMSYNENGGKCVLYVNGNSVASGTAGSLTGPLTFTNVGKVVFGCVQFMTTPSQTSGTDSQPWASFNVGGTDQVRIYNDVLSATKASALYNLENAGR